jgi:hypothetical protein
MTVTPGAEELDAGVEPSPGRARRVGGGRKPLTENDPDPLEALDALVEPETRGDPMTRLRWATKSTRTLPPSASTTPPSAPGSASDTSRATRWRSFPGIGPNERHPHRTQHLWGTDEDVPGEPARDHVGSIPAALRAMLERPVGRWSR